MCTHTSVLRSISLTRRSIPSWVILWGMFAVTLGTSRLLPNSKGLTLITITASSSLSFIWPEEEERTQVETATATALLPGLSKTSWAGTLLKLNWVPSKGLLTFCKFWGNLRCVALSEFSLIQGKTHNIQSHIYCSFTNRLSSMLGWWIEIVLWDDRKLCFYVFQKTLSPYSQSSIMCVENTWNCTRYLCNESKFARKYFSQ